MGRWWARVFMPWSRLRDRGVPAAAATAVCGTGRAATRQMAG